MSKTQKPTNNNNKKYSPNLDVISSRNEAHLLKLKKARKLIGKVIQKDGADFGKIVEIVTIGDKIVAITDKELRIDVASIFRVLAMNNSSEKHYPDGTSYSRRVMRTPKSKGKGHALTGKNGINESQVADYEKYRRNGGRR